MRLKRQLSLRTFVRFPEKKISKQEVNLTLTRNQLNYVLNQIKYIVTKCGLGDFKHKVYPLCKRHVKILLSSESQSICQRMTVRFICNNLVMCLLRCEMKEIYSNILVSIAV